MNTPAHLAASILVWRGESGRGAFSAVVVGALLPDLPMYAFYGYEKLVVQSTEDEIWSTIYFQPGWQLLFDAFNSIPLMIAIIGIGYVFKSRTGILLGASALLHLWCDLPLHHDDAHRHFLPLTEWRFTSPVSYWDPKHFGIPFMCFEIIFTMGATLYVTWKGPHRASRLVAGLTLALYLGAIVFALIMWAPDGFLK